MSNFDAILIPGGGLQQDGSLPPWTIARLEQAISCKHQPRWFALLSGGTVHKPSPTTVGGYPIFESRQAAEYLINAGIPASRILTEISSYDTIGNALFARLLFAEPLKLENILIITSDFHMPRTKTIFERIFHLPPSDLDYQLRYENTPNRGLSANALAARMKRETNSLINFNKTISEINTLDDFLVWLYAEHAAYALDKAHKPISDDELKSY